MLMQLHQEIEYGVFIHTIPDGKLFNLAQLREKNLVKNL